MEYGSKCTAKGCRNVHYALGFCKKHYAEIRHYGHLKNDPTCVVSDDRPKCKADGCERLKYAKGYCMKHYQRVRLYGHINYSRKAHKKRTATFIKCKTKGCKNNNYIKGYCKKHCVDVIPENTIYVSKNKNGIGELDIEVKGCFVKYTNGGLFKDDTGNYWMRMDNGIYKIIDLVVRDKKAKIFESTDILSHEKRVAYDKYIPKIYSTKSLRQ